MEAALGVDTEQVLQAWCTSLMVFWRRVVKERSKKLVEGLWTDVERLVDVSNEGVD